MINEMRTCPSCRTRVLPNPDDTCPACRTHKFQEGVPDSVVRAAIAVVEKAEHEVSVWTGARAFWRLQWTVAASLVLNLINLIAFEWRVPKAGTALSTWWLFLSLASVVFAVAALVAAYAVAKWLRWGAPVVWAILAGLPYLSLITFIVLSRGALAEFKKQQVSMRLFGPRIPRQPEAASSAPE